MPIKVRAELLLALIYLNDHISSTIRLNSKDDNLFKGHPISSLNQLIHPAHSTSLPYIMPRLCAMYVLDSGMTEPVKFDFFTNKYHVCPECARAHELRTCRGDITVTFKLCGNHLDA